MGMNQLLVAQKANTLLKCTTLRFVTLRELVKSYTQGDAR